MKPKFKQSASIVALILALGVVTAVDAAKDDKVDPALYQGLEPDQAAEQLLEKALVQAGKGTWERIAVAQIYYLSGNKERAEAIFDGIKKKEAGDWMRIARIYYRAGDWDKAKQTFDRVMDMAPKDEDWLAEIGAYYNLKGDRDKAEELFNRSFGLDPDNLYNTLSAAGSFLGVEER